MNFNEQYGKILRNYRKINHFTQEKVSDLTGLAPRYISQIERGELKGSINTLIAFCNAYKITPNDILLDFLNPKPNNITTNNYDSKINSLNLHDKELIDILLNFLLAENDKKVETEKICP